MLERHTQLKTKQRVEIGVSKACCEWCYEYLKLLALPYPKSTILVRASHGKQPDGWMIPPDTPKLIATRVEEMIEDRIDDVIWEILGRRRSDSNELTDFTEEPDLGARKQAIIKNKLGVAVWDA